jgi:hypothetical protein
MRAGHALCLVAALLLNGCGGGVSFGFGDFWDDIPPSVSLAGSATTVQAGQPLRLVAAASDSDSGVERVSFYRVDGVDSTLLGSDTREPYEWDTTAPVDGRTTLVVFARAQDWAGNWSESVALTITITP